MTVEEQDTVIRAINNFKAKKVLVENYEKMDANLELISFSRTGSNGFPVSISKSSAYR